jgi:hypothetical protein
MPWQLLEPKPRAPAMAPLNLHATCVKRAVLSRGTRDLVIMLNLLVVQRGWAMLRRISMFTRRVLIALAGALACMLSLLTCATLAHVDIDVGDGQYVMEVGFRDEPAYLGQPNAVHVSVEEYATGGTEPVEGLAATLGVEVSRDGKTLSVPLEPRGDGVYEGAFVPTATGDYTFRVFGTIGDAAVDESVTSGPSTFDSVEPMSAIEFPVERPDAVQLRSEIADVAGAVGTARTLGIVSIAAGVLGLILGAVALVRAGRPKTEPAPRPIEPSGKLIR